jgi:hypothetical protein
MSHLSHLEFLGNSESSGVFHQPGVDAGDDLEEDNVGSSSLSSSSSLRPNGATGPDVGADEVDQRPTQTKYVLIVDYLSSLKLSQGATYADIRQKLKIDLSREPEVLEMLKVNPRIDATAVGDEGPCAGEYNLRYIQRHHLKDKGELLRRINYVKSGIPLSDLRGCYEGVAEDVGEAIESGEIIGVKNRYKKDLVLYPRLRPFISRLSGVVEVCAGDTSLKTSADLTGEVRRGEAVRVGQPPLAPSWFRISCATSSISVVDGAVGSGTAPGATPTSVTLDKDLYINSQRNVYSEPFTAERLPLNMPYDGAEAPVAVKTEDTQVKVEGRSKVEGQAEASGLAVYRHGCTSDVKAQWFASLEHMKSFQLATTTNNNNDGPKKLAMELVRQGLIGRENAMTVFRMPVKRTAEQDGAQRKRGHKMHALSTSITAQHNTHLAGTELGRILQKSAAELMIKNNASLENN